MHLVMILCYFAYLDNRGIINLILHTSAHVRCTSNERWYVWWINNWNNQIALFIIHVDVYLLLGLSCIQHHKIFKYVKHLFSLYYANIIKLFNRNISNVWNMNLSSFVCVCFFCNMNLICICRQCSYYWLN